MAITLPVLGSDRWVTDPTTMMARLFGHIFVTDYSQSNIYAHKVTSIQFLISQHQNDAPNLASAIETTIKAYYGKYFESVEVYFRLVETSENVPETAAMYFNIEITAEKDGVKYNLNKSLSVDKASGATSVLNALNPR